MFREQVKEKNSILGKVILYLFVFIAIINIIFKIRTELVSEKVASLNLLKKSKELSFLDSKTTPNMGWYNLKEWSRNYEKGFDINFISFQYMIVPTILENNGSNKKIICYYSSPEQLDDFCKKKKKYKLIEKDIFSNLAILERKTDALLR